MEIKTYLQNRSSKLNESLEKVKTDLDANSKRLDEIRAESEQEGKTEDELKALNDELDLISAKKAELEAEKAEKEAELAEIEAQLKALDEQDNKGDEGTPAPEPNNGERAKFLVFESRTGGKQTMTIEERKALEEKRAAEVKEKRYLKRTAAETRAILVSSGKVATPTEVSGIEDTFNRVSSIVDLVRVVNCEGMGSNKVAYEVSLGTAATRNEGEAVAESDPQYDYVTITPSNIGILSYISREVEKQTPLNYEAKVVDSAEKALRIKAANVITSKIVASTIVSKPAKLKITAVSDKTLRDIVLHYGSDSAIYGNAYLFLTHDFLIKLGDLRSDLTKQAVYEITPDEGNPNIGTIKDGGLSVRYCLNPNLPTLDSASEDDVVAFYGQPECAELDLFGDYEVKVSEDAKGAFENNMLAIRGVASLGADVIKKDGFVCVTKGA